MAAPMDVADVTAALRAWDCQVRSVEATEGGWNSSTWQVETDTGRYVAKLADLHDEVAFLGGLAVARCGRASLFPTGAPVPTRAGQPALRLSDGLLALLEFVPGRPPDLQSPADTVRVGGILARAHRALQACRVDLGPRHSWPWGWVEECLDTLSMRDDVRGAARRVWRAALAAAETETLSMGLIHADPGPDAFRLHPRTPEHDGLVDWSAALRGPLLYDLASFDVMTRSTCPDAADRCVDGYLSERPEFAAELDQLAVFVRLRWMANSIYFSSRIERGITRGSSSPSANEDGLARAYHGMIST